MRVADFFCGGGGFSEGFRQAGFQIVFAIDKWEPAINTYKGNKPGVNAILGDVIEISLLDDAEFEKMVPDSEVIIGSPPCQSFSQSNKSGNADKTVGIKLIEAYLRIIARKKYKNNSCLKYWVLENVPNVKKYIKEEYTAADLKLEGDFVLRPHDGAAGIYNAKYFGAPTNRKRYLCGEFPPLIPTHNDENAVKLKDVLQALGNPEDGGNDVITDVNYPELRLARNRVSDHHYIYELAEFEIDTAKRLKQDKGYMGKMSFPENIEKPARTVMATMSASSREAMILSWKNDKYRLPTVREVATMMSFPIDYRFYGNTKANKHTLVGNAVPPKMSYAIAKAILLDSNENIPDHYIPIHYDDNIPFYDLNGEKFETKKEKRKRPNSKFKYHIPYMILKAYRVELTNYASDFENHKYCWSAEIHYSQGKGHAAKYTPKFSLDVIPKINKLKVREFIQFNITKIKSKNNLQKAFCMTQEERIKSNITGPYELLSDVKKFIINEISESDMNINIELPEESLNIPLAICMGYYIINSILKKLS